MLTTRHRTAEAIAAALATPLVALLLTAPATGQSPAAAPPPSVPPNPGVAPRQRPEDLVILEEKITHGGRLSIGVFGATRDVGAEDVWRVRIWQETAESVEVSTDMVDCSRTAPMRITEHAGRLVLRHLNPGGLITPVNRLDHLIWWAVCSPEQAGLDPADLAPIARQLGYGGNLQEREELLPVSLPRPR